MIKRLADIRTRYVNVFEDRDGRKFHCGGLITRQNADMQLAVAASLFPAPARRVYRVVVRLKQKVSDG